MVPGGRNPASAGAVPIRTRSDRSPSNLVSLPPHRHVILRPARFPESVISTLGTLDGLAVGRRFADAALGPLGAADLECQLESNVAEAQPSCHERRRFAEAWIRIPDVAWECDLVDGHHCPSYKCRGLARLGATVPVRSEAPPLLGFLRSLAAVSGSCLARSLPVEPRYSARP